MLDQDEEENGKVESDGMETDGDESKPGALYNLVKKSKGENGNTIDSIVPGVQSSQNSIDLNLPIPNPKGEF